MQEIDQEQKKNPEYSYTNGNMFFFPPLKVKEMNIK